MRRGLIGRLMDCLCFLLIFSLVTATIFLLSLLWTEDGILLADDAWDPVDTSSNDFRSAESMSFGANTELINVDEYLYRLTPNVTACNPSTAHLKDFVIVIHSDASTAGKRESIRSTLGLDWIRNAFKFDVIFVLGYPALANLQESQERIIDESDEFRDILQGSFVDTYQNLTLKSVSWIKYISEHCSAEIIVKIDDDLLVNLEFLQRMISQHSPAMQNSYACLSHKNQTMPILRDPKKKWFVSGGTMSKDHTLYPAYCAGLAYTTSHKVISKAYQYLKTHKVHFHNIDDFFVTGKLAAETGVGHSSIWEYYAPFGSRKYTSTAYAFFLFHNKQYKVSFWNQIVASWQRLFLPLQLYN